MPKNNLFSARELSRRAQMLEATLAQYYAQLITIEKKIPKTKEAKLKEEESTLLLHDAF